MSNGRGAVHTPTTNSYSDTGLSANTTYRYQVRAADAANNLSGYSTIASATTQIAPVDSTPPTVSLTAPTSGSTVSGSSVTVSANASDPSSPSGQATSGVSGVQFLLDGSNLQTEDTTSPYSITWNTTIASNGSHILTARARDAAGNQTTSVSVTVTVDNTVPPPSAGLVAAYSFNAGSGSVLVDISGNANQGTISGALWITTGRYGSALSFDGTNDFVTVGDSNSLDLTTTFTVEAWVYPTQFGGTYGGWRTVLIKEQPNQLTYGLWANSDTSRPSFHVYLNDGDYSVRGTAQLPLNAWSHLAATYDGITELLYVNGVLVGSRAVAGSAPISANQLRIGGSSVWGEYFRGRIDEIRMYNRTLSQAEIQADMAMPL